MRTMSWVGYLLLLAVAFLVGLAGTVAASRALVTAVSRPPAHIRAVENTNDVPANIPVRRDLPTTEC